METTEPLSVQAEEGRDAAITLVRNLLAVRPLIDALAPPVNVFPVAGGHYGDEPVARLRNLARLETFLNRVASRIGAPAFTMCPDGIAPRHSVFELAVSQRLLGAQAGFGGEASFEMDASDDVIDAVVAWSFDRQYFRGTVASDDGTRLRAYAAGDRDKAPVVLISPCGMPAKLCEQWIDLLARHYFVITWESRLLFEEPGNRESFAFDVDAQVTDLFAIMQRFDVSSVHLMSMCGGAVIGVAAAAARPERVSSLSLWHGDFEGGGCPITKHQKDLKAFMRGVAAGRRQAEQLHRLFSQNTLKNFREEVAHLVLYPYANAELLYRYAKSNGSIMDTDVTPLLARVTQPTVVVTSADDSTTHPEGSMRVAELLPSATLEVIAHGDHLSLFNAGPEVARIATSFLARHMA